MRKLPLVLAVLIAIVLFWQWRNLPPCSTDSACEAMHGFSIYSEEY